MASVITIEQLASWQPTRTTYGVVGFPVAHSRSPAMHQAALNHLKLDADYLAFEVPPERLGEALPLWSAKGVAGLNLTIPHKQLVLGMVAELSDEVREIGAANTLVNTTTGWSGHNTDGRGFSKAVREIFRYSLRELRVLVLGAGGAARAIALQCAREGADRVVIANRTEDKATALADEIARKFTTEKLAGQVARFRGIALSSPHLAAELDTIDLIVNATSVGLKSGDPSPLPTHLLQPHHLVYDTIYAPSVTPLMRAAIEAGARAENGLGMLLHQGALSFELWTGQAAPLDVMRAALG
jgi:shikimate dehydrogenase